MHYLEILKSQFKKRIKTYILLLSSRQEINVNTTTREENMMIKLNLCLVYLCSIEKTWDRREDELDE
jgi:hypothetical protein